jgi:hypothetical protein
MTTKTMHSWHVWFRGRAEPVKCVTAEPAPIHAIATASDMIKADASARLRIYRVELLEPDGRTALAWRL